MGDEVGAKRIVGLGGAELGFLSYGVSGSSPGTKRRTAVWISRPASSRPQEVLAVAGSLRGNRLELDEGVQDGDGLGADTGVEVHMRQDLVR